jgi:hypothetical protein
LSKKTRKDGKSTITCQRKRGRIEKAQFLVKENAEGWKKHNFLSKKTRKGGKSTISCQRKRGRMEKAQFIVKENAEGWQKHNLLSKKTRKDDKNLNKLIKNIKPELKLNLHSESIEI